MAKKTATPATITLKHLAAALAEEHELSKKTAEAILTDLVTKITKHLKKGERIRIENKKVFIDGEPLDEPYVHFLEEPGTDENVYSDPRGMRTMMTTLNGQLRPVQVRDRTVAADVPEAERADRTNPDHVAAPFAGVVTLTVGQGDKVEAGQTVATIEAMKMEAAITAARPGTVRRLAIGRVQQVEGGDLLVVLG